MAPPPVSPAIRRISEQIAEIIGDGDCLQIGIGGIPNTVLAMIGDRRHLGIHTDLLTERVVNMNERPPAAVAPAVGRRRGTDAARNLT